VFLRRCLRFHVGGLTLAGGRRLECVSCGSRWGGPVCWVPACCVRGGGREFWIPCLICWLIRGNCQVSFCAWVSGLLRCPDGVALPVCRWVLLVGLCSFLFWCVGIRGVRQWWALRCVEFSVFRVCDGMSSLPIRLIVMVVVVWPIAWVVAPDRWRRWSRRGFGWVCSGDRNGACCPWSFRLVWWSVLPFVLVYAGCGGAAGVLLMVWVCGLGCLVGRWSGSGGDWDCGHGV